MTQGEVTVNEQGRVTISAQACRDLRLTAGTKLVAYVEDGRLILESPDHLPARIQDAVARASSQASGVVDELIAARRAEATREQAETGGG